MKKKVFSIVAAMVIGLCLFSGCKQFSDPFSYDGHFFDKEHLEKHLIPDLPQPKEAEVVKDYGQSIYYEMSEEMFEEYAREVYDYILSCDFQRLGTPGSIWITHSQATVRPCSDFEDYKHDFAAESSITDAYGYIFAWANERGKKDENRWVSHYLQVILGKDGTINLQLCNSAGYPLTESNFN